MIREDQLILFLTVILWIELQVGDAAVRVEDVLVSCWISDVEEEATGGLTPVDCLIKVFTAVRDGDPVPITWTEADAADLKQTILIDRIILRLSQVWFDCFSSLLDLKRK